MTQEWHVKTLASSVPATDCYYYRLFTTLDAPEIVFLFAVMLAEQVGARPNGNVSGERFMGSSGKGSTRQRHRSRGGRKLPGLGGEVTAAAQDSGWTVRATVPV